jgi:hypothetical protein
MLALNIPLLDSPGWATELATWGTRTDKSHENPARSCEQASKQYISDCDHG